MLSRRAWWSRGPSGSASEAAVGRVTPTRIAPPMSRRILAAAAACAATALLAATGCSSTQTKLAVAEGTPVTLGNTQYDVQISRYLNPNDPEDEGYLQGAP